MSIKKQTVVIIIQHYLCSYSVCSAVPLSYSVVPAAMLCDRSYRLLKVIARGWRIDQIVWIYFWARCKYLVMSVLWCQYQAWGDTHFVLQCDFCDGVLLTMVSSACGGETVQRWCALFPLLLYSTLHMSSGNICSIQQTIGLHFMF